MPQPPAAVTSRLHMPKTPSDPMLAALFELQPDFWQAARTYAPNKIGLRLVRGPRGDNNERQQFGNGDVVYYPYFEFKEDDPEGGAQMFVVGLPTAVAEFKRGSAPAAAA